MKGVKQAVDLARDIAAMETDAKLSADAFQREALEAANTTDERLDLIESELEHPDYAAAQQLIRKLVEMIGSANVRNVPDADRMAMIIRVNGGDAAEAQFASLGSKASDAFALAARHAAKRYADRFGVIEDWQTYQATLADMRDKYGRALAAINFDYSDLMIDHDAVTPSQRDSGLCRVSFWSTSGAVTLGHGWQQRLVEWHLAQPTKAAA